MNTIIQGEYIVHNQTAFARVFFRHIVSKCKQPRFMALVLMGSVILSSFAVVQLHHFAAHAAGATLSVTPAAGAYSAWNQITVQGQNYGANETVTIYWNYTGKGTGSLLSTAVTSSVGSFTTNVGRTLAPTGIYIIAGVGLTSGLIATASFNLLPQMYGGPLDTGPGTKIHINGNAFGAGESVNIYWNYNGTGTGTLLASATANTTGSFLVYAIIPGSTIHGFVTLTGVGQSSGTVGTTQLYIYPPTLTLAPLNGGSGISLTYSAYGFSAYENVSFYWNGSSTPIATIKTDIYGYIPPTSFSVPANINPGPYLLKAVGATSHTTITNTYTVVAPSSSLKLSSGPVGTSVSVTGQGYTPGESINLIWNYSGPDTGTVLVTTHAGWSGAFNATITIPLAANGSYPIAAVGVNSQRVTQSTFVIINGVTVSLPTAPPGTAITLSGTGFQANETVSLYWDSIIGNPFATATADANGNVNQALSFPTTATPGSHTLISVGQTSQQSFTTTVTINTAWSDFGFTATHTRQNMTENMLSITNVSKLRLKWTATTNIKVKNSGCGAPGNVSSPLYANGMVYYATDDGLLNAYDALTGAIKWQFDSQSSFPNCSSPLLDPTTGLIFFGTVGYNGAGVPTPFYALDAQTGTLKWSIIFPWNEYSFPTHSLNTLYLGMSREAYNEALYSIDTVSGHINWTHLTTGGVWGEAVVDTTTNALFTSVGNPTPHVDALNATTGALLWEFTPSVYGNNDDVGAPLSLANGLVYASSKNGIIYALNESNGNVVWSTQIGAQSNQDMSGPAVSSSGMVYVGSNDGPLDALDGTSGVIVWKYTTRGPVYSSPIIANGVVYFASTDHRFYALNATTGALLWTYLTGGQSYASPIVVNGWFYCGSSDGKLYAFSL